MHTIDVFQWYNLFIGALTAGGFVYLLTRHRSIYSYQRFVHVLVLGLVLFAVGGPLVELFATDWSHAIHTIAAVFVIYGLYSPVTNDLRREAWGNLVLRDPSDIRDPAEWMAPLDDEILNLFHATNLVLTPSIIAYNTGYSREAVNRRLGELTEGGLIDRVERGKYRITPLGETYLAGEYVVKPGNHPTAPESH